MKRDRDLTDIGVGKGDKGDGQRRPDGPLDGSTSGTIGGGGPETGGSTARTPMPETPPVHPEDAASGRGDEDPLDTAMPRDPLKPGATSVTRRRS